MKKLLSILLALALLASCAAAAAADPEPEDFVCPEDQIATKIPAGAAARFEEDNGLVIYTQAEGYIPYVIVHRRPLENKFNNPENYLNNVFREYMEETHQDKYLGMYGAAKAVETGGKTLLEGCYKFKIGDTPVTLLRLIEIRDGGDVEYTAKFTEDTEEITMAALDLAVRYYRETDLEAPETPETPEAPAAPAGTGSVPAFLIPYQFAERFNAAI